MSSHERARSLLALHALRLWALGLVLALGACEPVKLPHEQPGPAGCGTRDPRSTAPGMLSVAQKEAFRLSGSPHEVRPNDVGGLDWLYRRSTGSVFGEEQTVEMLRFDKDGLLVGRDTELLRKVGK
ncbi:MAG: hypothetical protein ACO3JL_09790 [Myxococcota bacterium]